MPSSAGATDVRAVREPMQPLSLYLGVLGMTGLTAWAVLNLAQVKAGDVIFISGAAGAVGNVAGQLAKLRGCRVIGSAGSDAKVKILLDTCGFDAAFNYKTGPTLDHLQRVAPEGIDVYFDNVGGESLEAALATLRLHGRIIACGGIASDNDEKPKPGPANLIQRDHQTANPQRPHCGRLAGSPGRVRKRNRRLPPRRKTETKKPSSTGLTTP